MQFWALLFLYISSAVWNFKKKNVKNTQNTVFIILNFLNPGGYPVILGSKQDHLTWGLRSACKALGYILVFGSPLDSVEVTFPAWGGQRLQVLQLSLPLLLSLPGSLLFQLLLILQASSCENCCSFPSTPDSGIRFPLINHLQCSLRINPCLHNVLLVWNQQFLASICFRHLVS